jgi:hypothetical protein
MGWAEIQTDVLSWAEPEIRNSNVIAAGVHTSRSNSRG